MQKEILWNDPMIRIFGCGNPLMGDDGIGVHVIDKLKNMYSDLPNDIELIDMGACGLDMLNFLEGSDHVIIVDAIKSNGDIGSVHRFELNDLKEYVRDGMFTIHDVGIVDVLSIAEHVQKMPDSIVLFGIEIGQVDDISFVLSDKVRACIDVVIDLMFDEPFFKRASLSDIR
ncbi:MAG: hydrogenase maturation protease [Methanococcoides sp.]|uniref:Hydrogenase maturation protease n=1 Tax=Methanococcoides seepicolus TaxID=2828780 RepID=A0A9E4ZB39_9EURY|nr:hydrogenase maturation protease [Methanococcoides seepicolus]MCM1985566.1 hydrogenase maturation protease [Methanococcoides seepicolus]NOQ48986.1 hydrogenase maturation protease [Methanococcoides sp.]